MHHASSTGSGTGRLRPRSRLGRWAVSLLFASFVFFGLFFTLVGAGEKGGETFFSNPWLSGTILPAAGLAVASGAAGLAAAVRDHDRSPGVLAAIAIGLLVAFFIIGEIVFPH